MSASASSSGSVRFSSQLSVIADPTHARTASHHPSVGARCLCAAGVYVLASIDFNNPRPRAQSITTRRAIVVPPSGSHRTSDP